MATITKRDNRPAENRWQATIRRKGFPTQCKSFPTKAEAVDWAQVTESAMRRGSFVDGTAARETTLGDLFSKYARHVSPTKKGGAEEAKRLERMQRWTLAKYAVANVTSDVLATWRDDRLKEVSGSTVNRELNLISHVFTTAMIEWRMHLPVNPVSRIRRPKSNKARERRFEGDEEVRLLQACRQSRNAFLWPAVILAIETSMRRSEIVSLEWPLVNLEKRVVYLSDTKNGEGRAVALSVRAADALAALPTDRNGPVFANLTVDAIKCAYRRARRRAKIDGLRLHDLRHEATSRLFEKGLNPMEVASMTGHKTLSMLKRYLLAETVLKRGAFEEKLRLQKISRNDIADYALANLSAKSARDYRDKRLKQVSAATVIRELNLLAVVVKWAIRELAISLQMNPFSSAFCPRPRQPSGRERRFVGDEEMRLFAALEECRNQKIPKAVRFLLLTACRRGEMLNLRWTHVDFDHSVVHLTAMNSKTPRVPKLKYAQLLIDLLSGNVHVGLRPEEYSFSILRGHELTVRNGKESEERAHGKFRHLILSELPEHVIESVQRTGEVFRGTFWTSWEKRCVQLAERLFADNCRYFGVHFSELKDRDASIHALFDALLFFDQESLSPEILETALAVFDEVSIKPVADLYAGLRKNMRKVVLRVFPRRVKAKLPAIYSTRHQCSANLKKAGLSPAEIAAILGHKIERSNQVHYARKVSGEVTVGVVRARPDEIEKVLKYTAERAARHGNGLSPRKAKM